MLTTVGWTSADFLWNVKIATLKQTHFFSWLNNFEQPRRSDAACLERSSGVNLLTTTIYGDSRLATVTRRTPIFYSRYTNAVATPGLYGLLFSEHTNLEMSTSSDSFTHFRCSDVIYFQLYRILVMNFTTGSVVGLAISGGTVGHPHMGESVETRRKSQKSKFFFNFGPLFHPQDLNIPLTQLPIFCRALEDLSIDKNIRNCSLCYEGVRSILKVLGLKPS